MMNVWHWRRDMADDGKNQKTAMTTEERAGHYISLASAYHEAYDARRSLEWKIHVGLWTLLAALGYAMLTFKLVIPFAELIPLAAAFVVLHALWMLKMHQGQMRDLRFAVDCRDKAKAILDRAEEGPIRPVAGSHSIKSAFPEKLDRLFASYYWWPLIEIPTTVVIAWLILAAALAVPRLPEDTVTKLSKQVERLENDLVQLQHDHQYLQTRLEVQQSGSQTEIPKVPKHHRPDSK